MGSELELCGLITGENVMKRKQNRDLIFKEGNGYLIERKGLTGISADQHALSQRANIVKCKIISGSHICNQLHSSAKGAHSAQWPGHKHNRSFSMSVSAVQRWSADELSYTERSEWQGRGHSNCSNASVQLLAAGKNQVHTRMEDTPGNITSSMYKV